MDGQAKQKLQEPELMIKIDNIKHFLCEIENRTQDIITTSNYVQDFDDREVAVNKENEITEKDLLSIIAIIEQRLSRINNNLTYVSNKFQNLIG